MIFQVSNVKVNLLHMELIDAGLVPTLVEVTSDNSADLHFEDGTSTSAIQAIVDVHDSTLETIDDEMERKLYEFKIINETPEQLRTFFRSLDSEHQLQFRKAFSEYYASQSGTQTDVNLAFETMFRLLFKVLRIKDVEQRALTSEEQTEYETLLGYFNDHNTALASYLPITGWGLSLVNRVIDDFNVVRFADVFPKLAVITGPIIEERIVTSTVESVEGSVTTS